MAKALYKAGDMERAESKIIKSIQGYEMQISPYGFRQEHPHYITMVIDLSEIYAEQGKHEEAMEQLKKCELLCKLNKEKTLLDVQLCFGNAFAFWKSKDLTTALMSAEKGSSLLEDMGYSDHPYYAKANFLISQIRIERSQNDDIGEAVECLNRAQTILSRKFNTPIPVATVIECKILQLQADLSTNDSFKKECLQKASKILQLKIDRESNRKKEEHMDLPVLLKWRENYSEMTQKLKGLN